MIKCAVGPHMALRIYTPLRRRWIFTAWVAPGGLAIEHTELESILEAARRRRSHDC